MSHGRSGAALLHPVALTAIAVMLVNDHVLKQCCPSWLSGKLSDVTGLVLCPLLLQALYECVEARGVARPAAPHPSNRALWVGVVSTGAGYTLVELWQPAELVWCWTWGVLSWPLRAAVTFLSHGALHPLRPVRATSDLSDLAVLPALWVALHIGRRRTSHH